MIPINELRVGSYYNYDASPIKLDGDFLAMYLQNDTDLYLEPIRLTEQWLLDFGLIKENEYPYKFLNGLIKVRNGIYFYKYYKLEVDIQHVHQLQKLYFALTRIELIKKI